MAKNPFHQLHVIRNASRKGKIITDCYRLMYRSELWIKAYMKLYPDAGKLQMETIESIIRQLKTGTFRFMRVSKKVLPKNTREQKLFEAPVCQDKLVQEVIRMILESVYVSTFSSHSHSFREGRSCHTALSQIKQTWKGLTWCIKGQIKDFSEQINHSVLVNIISKKINDRRFLLLIHNALTCGVMEGWASHKPYSSTANRGTLAPLLANIYFHQFDLFMEKQIRIPAMTFMDHDHQKMDYVRYADEFVIGVAGSKASAFSIKEMIKNFLKDELHLDLSEEKTFIMHLKKPIPFLGYEFQRWNRLQLKRDVYKKQGILIDAIKLEIPKAKMKEFARTNGYGNLDNFNITHRTKLMNISEVEILHIYNAELKGMASYYKLADNYHHLNKLFYLAESSFIKTIANKRKSSFMKTAASMRVHKQGVLCLAEKNQQGMKQLHQFVKLKDLPKVKGTVKAAFRMSRI